MPNLIKKSWTVSRLKQAMTSFSNVYCFPVWGDSNVIAKFNRDQWSPKESDMFNSIT